MNPPTIQQAQTKKIIERLCSLPLFMGISRSDMEIIIGSVRFLFQKYPKFKTVCNIHEINNAVYFLIEGTIEITRMNHNNTILFLENINGPMIIGADVLFGISHSHTYTYKAKTDCQFLILDKKEIVSKMLNYEIFRLNLLNHISLNAQRRALMLHEPFPEDLAQRFIQYIKHNTSYPAGFKQLRCRQKDLGKELLTNEKNICQMLKGLKNKHLITTSRVIITIPSFQHLL